MKINKVAITGASGFIGGNLVSFIKNRVESIKCLVRNTSITDRLTGDNIKLIKGDLLNTNSLSELTRECDTVFHLAAFVSDWGKRDDFIKVNYDSTRNLLLESARNGVKKFVYLSTSSVVWRSDFNSVHNLINIDESYPYPSYYNDYYNETKAMAEKLVIESNGRDGLKTVVLRPSGVWGAGDRVILPRLIKAAIKGFLIPAGNGSSMVTPCHIDNLVEAVQLAAISENSQGNIYFINDGFKINHLNFIQKLLDASGVKWEPAFIIPFKIAYSLAYILELLYKLFNIQNPPVISRFAVSAIAGTRTYSIENARKDLNYSPSVDLENGLKGLKKWVDNLGGYEKLLI